MSDVPARLADISQVPAYVDGWCQAMTQWLAQATDYAEAQDKRREALAMEQAIKVMTGHRDDAARMQREVGAVRLRIEAWLGERVLQLREEKGSAQGRKRGSVIATTPTTEELGLGRVERKRIEALAKANRAGKLDAYIQESEEADEPVSTNGAIRFAKGAHVSHNSGENEWYTPGEYIAAARKVLGTIDLDPASSARANETVCATTYYSEQQSGLDEANMWRGKVWMNPPYAQPLISHFISRVVREFQSGNIEAAIVLVNNGTDAVWGQMLLKSASAVCFPAGRIRFIDVRGNPGGAPLQGQMVVYLGAKPEAFGAVFSLFGTVLYGV